MTEQNRPINVVNIVTGLCFVTLGVLLLMNRTGTVEVRQIVELWPLVLILLGGAVAWQASRGGEAAASAASGAGPLVWLVLLGLLFSHVFGRRSAAEEARTDGEMNVFAVLSGNERPVPTGPFAGGTVTTLLGGAKIDLTTSALAPGETAVIDVFTILGGVDIRAPRHWRIDIETTSVAAGVSDQRGREESGAVDPAADGPGSSGGATGVIEPATDAAPAPRLVIKGVVVLGGVTVK